MRASLLAMATTTTFLGALASSASSHAPIGARSRLQISICVLEDIRHRFPKLRWSLREHQTSFEQKIPQLVDDCRASGDQSIANTMNRLQIQLIICLDVSA
jgi:hypothetical protein